MTQYADAFHAPADIGQNDEPRLVGQIEQMIAAGDLDSAEAAAKQWAAVVPHATAPLMLLGMIYDKSGRSNDALDIAGRLLPSDPGFAAMLATKAWLVLRQTRPMLATARDWVRYDPDNDGAWMALYVAAAARDVDEPVSRVEALRALIRLPPSSQRVESMPELADFGWLRRALSMDLGKLGRWEDLADLGRQWLADTPQLDAHMACLTALDQLGRHEDIVEHIENADPAVCQSTFVTVMLMKAYNGLGRHSDVLAAATRVLGRNDCPDLAWRLQAEALHRTGHQQAAVTAIQHYLRSQPNDIWAIRILCEALIDLRRYKEALPAAELWLATEPLPSAWSFKCDALLGLRRWREAQAVAESLLRMFPTDPNVAGKMALALAGAGDLILQPHLALVESSLVVADAGLVLVPASPS